MVSSLCASLHVTHVIGFPIDFNGNLRRSSSEAIHTAKHGVNVDYAVSREGARNLFNDTTKAGQDDGRVNVIPLRTIIPRTVAQHLSWRVNNLVALPLQTLKIALKGTILHVHAPTPVFKPFSISLVNKLSKCPMVLDLHDPWSGHPFPIIGSFEMQLRTQFMRYAINNSNSVIVAHTALIEPVHRINPKKQVDVIPNGVDVELFKPAPKNEALSKKLGINKDELVIAFSGHVTNEKGLDILAKSASSIVQNFKTAKFLVVGDGLFIEEVKALVNKLQLKDKFIFTGFVSAEKLPGFLSISDVCVAPYTPGPWYQESKVETPIKVVEYMAMGKPVIMSRISEENVLVWGDGGLLVTPGSVPELASSIITLLEDKGLRMRLGDNGRRFIEKEYSWQKITKKLVKIYQSLNECN